MIPKICESCGKQFEVFPSRSRQRFCSRSCGMKGKHNSSETEFTSSHLKQLWQNPDFKKKMLDAHKGNLKGFKKGNKPWNKGGHNLQKSYWKGKHHAEEAKKKISLSRRLWYEKIPLEERRFSEEHKQKLSIALSGERNPMYGKPCPNKNWREQFNDPEFQRKRLWALNHGPTKPEKQVIYLITKHSLPFKYVGDGEIIINRLVPDFIAANGEKKIIEVFGDYWHGRGADNWTDTEEGRKEVFYRLGYDTLIIWEWELKQFSEEDIVNRIRAFSDGSVTTRDV